MTTTVAKTRSIAPFARKRSLGRCVRTLPGTLVLVAVAFTSLFPIVLVLLNSVKMPTEVTGNPLGLPAVPDLANYSEAWDYGGFARGFINSILLTGTTVLVVLATATPAAYVISAKKVKGLKLAAGYLLIAMTVPIQLFLFPLYAAFAKMGLLNNVYAVGVVVAALNMPLAVLLLKSFFDQIPAELPEAAAVDGATTLDQLRYVLYPAVSPGLITVGIVVGLMAWNEYLISVTFLQQTESFTATLGFLSLSGTFATDQGVLMAGAGLLIVPLVIFFVIAQRYFVDGLVGGAIKG